jgi:hypothetical protein
MRTLDIEWGLKPYSDNSGFEYHVRLTERDGTRHLCIKSVGGEIYVDADDWNSLRDTVADILFFAERSTPKERAQ